MSDATEDNVVEVLRDAYAAFADLVGQIDDERSWAPTACRGWSARDLTHHAMQDATRALVALHTPANPPVDRTDITYWKDWGPDPRGAANGRRYTRVVASMFADWPQLRAEYLAMNAAVVDAAGGRPVTAVVGTQGHVLSVGHLCSSLAVEATIHHLDVLAGATSRLPGPAPSALSETRRVLEALAGQAFPADWSDVDCARVGTGRQAPGAPPLAQLGAMAQRLPLFC